MKYRKYILMLILFLVLFTGLNRVEAVGRNDKCYYMSDDFKAVFSFEAMKYQDIRVDFINGEYDSDSEDMLNWRDVKTRSNTTIAGHKFKNLYSSEEDAGANGVCPDYLVVQYCPGKILFEDEYRLWGTNDKSEAIDAVNGINNEKNCVGRYASFKHDDGITRFTGDEYYSTLIRPNSGGEKICDPKETNPNSPDYCEKEKVCDAIFGDINYAGETDVDTNGNGYIDPPSLAYLINSVLKYIRIIVPILIILLGSLDFAKAVVAGKEDEMRKAQKTFVKRVIAGIIVFFVPVIVNLVMQLADVVWDGMGLSHCELP